MRVIRGIQDIATMFTRCMRYTLRNGDTLITTVALPIVLMLLFVYVFGEAIDTGSTKYIDYVVPGILMLCIGQCSSTTALSINNDMTKGIIDRFQTMPIPRTVVLTGHVLASLVRNLISVSLVLVVAFIIGFRSSADFIEWFGVIGIILLYALAMTWISVVFGLLVHSAEGAGSYSFFITLLPYLSSAFIPTEAMSSAVKIFAKYQPITPINESIRSLLFELPVDNYILLAVIWCLGLICVSYFFSMIIYSMRSA